MNLRSLGAVAILLGISTASIEITFAPIIRNVVVGFKNLTFLFTNWPTFIGFYLALGMIVAGIVMIVIGKKRKQK